MQIDALFTLISPSEYNINTETNQNLSFSVSRVGGSAHLLVNSSLPSIDPTTGTLFLCLQSDSSGQQTYSVSLSDDGGTRFSGQDSFGFLKLMLVVEYVNQKPSFSVAVPNTCGVVDTCSECPSLCCSSVCCSPSVTIWEGFGAVVIHHFAHGLLFGNLIDGRDTEAWQNGTFSVLTINTSGTHTPPKALKLAQTNIDTSGTHIPTPLKLTQTHGMFLIDVMHLSISMNH